MFQLTVFLLKNNPRTKRCGLNAPTRSGPAHSMAGFTLIEMMFVILLALVMGAMAIPATQSAMATMDLNAAVDSVEGAIQATRYQAIMHGYPYQVAFNNTNNTFQVLSEVPPATTFSDVNGGVPVSGDPVTLSASPTYQFKANGSVSAVAGAMSFSVSYKGTTKTLTVSNYGSITIQ
jgi:Tfp pilus assembly protein FimT